MTSPDTPYSAQRHATRAPVDLSVRLQAEGSEAVFEGRCQNVSIGGMFVVTELLCGAGDQMRFELEIGEQETVHGLAEVIWRQPGDLRRRPGVGFRYRYLEQRDRQAIFKLVSRHIKDRLASRQPMKPASPSPQGEPPAVLQPPADSSPAGPPAFEIVPNEAPSSAEAAPPDPMPSPTSPEPSPPPSGQQSLELAPLEGEGASAPSRSSPQPLANLGAFASIPAPAGDPSSAVDLGAAREESPEPLGFDDLALDAEPDLPLGTPSAAIPSSGGPSLLEESEPEVDQGYSDYLGEDHFEHRPAPRRDWTPWVLVGLSLLLAAALAYLFGGHLFDLSSGEGTASTPTSSATTDPAREPPPAEAAAPDPGGATDPASASPPLAEAGEKPAEARPAAPTATSPSSSSPPPPRQDRSGRVSLAQLENLSFRRAGESVEIVISTGQAIGSHDHFRLDGGKPRVVIRLFGMKRFDGRELAVGHGGVRRARAGWHDRRGGPQMHVVLDLDDPRVEVRSTRVEGRDLIVLVGR